MSDTVQRLKNEAHDAYVKSLENHIESLERTLKSCLDLTEQEMKGAEHCQTMDLNPAALASTKGWYDAARGIRAGIQSLINQVPK